MLEDGIYQLSDGSYIYIGTMKPGRPPADVANDRRVGLQLVEDDTDISPDQEQITDTLNTVNRSTNLHGC